MRWLLLLLLAGCTKAPARETLPVVHVVCLGAQGPILDSYLTRAQAEKLDIRNVPCILEWGESFPVPQPSASPTPPNVGP